MKTPKLDFVVDTPIEESWLPFCEQAVIATLQHAKWVAQTSLTLLLGDDQTLQKLNQTFLGENKPTDVLSFPSGESFQQQKMHLGEIAISIPRARQQAEDAQHPLKSELQLLIVHGVLHLLGHDHAEPQEKAQMWQAQATILAQLNGGQAWQLKDDQWFATGGQ